MRACRHAHTMSHRHFPGNVVCTHLDVARRLSLAGAESGAQKCVKVVRLFSTGGPGGWLRASLCVRFRFFRLSQTEGFCLVTNERRFWDHLAGCAYRQITYKLVRIKTYPRRQQKNRRGRVFRTLGAILKATPLHRLANGGKCISR